MTVIAAIRVMLIEEEGLVGVSIRILLGFGVSIRVVLKELIEVSTRVVLEDEEFVGVSVTEVGLFVSGTIVGEISESTYKFTIASL